jgi:hypothetical protein
MRQAEDACSSHCFPVPRRRAGGAEVAILDAAEDAERAFQASRVEDGEKESRRRTT